MLALPPHSESTDGRQRDDSTCEEEDGATIKPKVVTGRKLPNIEAPFSDGRTAIWHAVGKGMAGVVERLVSMGASLKSDKPHGRTLLTYAISCGADSPVVSFLLTLAAAKPNHTTASGADPNSINEAANIPAVSLDIHEQNGAGETPLHAAASWSYNSSSSFINTLCSSPYNANVNIQDNQGSTPLITAIKHGHNSETQKILLNAGADHRSPTISAETRSTGPVCA